MLKAIVWKNFVHFKDKNVISFKTCLNETTPQVAGSIDIFNSVEIFNLTTHAFFFFFFAFSFTDVILEISPSDFSRSLSLFVTITINNKY